MKRLLFLSMFLTACGEPVEDLPIAGAYSVYWDLGFGGPCFGDSPPQTCSDTATIAGGPNFMTNGSVTFRHSGTGEEFIFAIVDGQIAEFPCDQVDTVTTARVTVINDDEVYVSSTCSTPTVVAVLTRL